MRRAWQRPPGLAISRNSAESSNQFVAHDNSQFLDIGSPVRQLLSERMLEGVDAAL